jgi:hypothetical protein
MLTSLKMEAIEECDSDDASALGGDVRTRSQADAIATIVGSGEGRPRSSSGEPRTKSSNPTVSKSRSSSGSEPTSTSGSRSRQENVPTLATSPAITQERNVDMPLPPSLTKIPSTEDDEDSETPTEKTTDDESSSETKEIRSFDLEDESCDGGIFDYDDEVSMLEAAKDEEEEDELTWRLDPEVSLSDWTVILTNKVTKEVKPYYLHKNILAVGPRKCDYFVGVFRKTNRTQEISSNKTEMSLDGPPFDCFPQFLDFVYSTGAIEVTTETATSMRHLAKCFGLKLMFKQATEFLLKDISLSNIITYYKHSVILQDEKITAMVARHLARNIMQVETTGELVKTVDPVFFVRVLSAPEIDLKIKQIHVSLLVAEYCKIHKERMDATLFLKLVDEKVLPVVDHSVALFMLEMEADLVVVKVSSITSLQKRCIKDLSYHWKEFSEAERELVGRVCKKLPSGVVTELLMKSLSQAKRKVENEPKMSLKNLADNLISKSKKDSDSSSVGSSSGEISKKQETQRLHQKRKEYDAKVADLKREHQEEMAHLKKEYETNLLKLRDLCLDKDKQIANYWQELQRHVRLPNAPEGKFTPAEKMVVTLNENDLDQAKCVEGERSKK